jgi:hypothetical protein
VFLYAGVKGISVTAALQSVISGKNPLTLPSVNEISSGAPASGTSSPIQSGTTTANGTAIYKYLRSNGYSPIQAAGAIASMWGESTWDPESVGTGGCGLMGWTPESSLSAYGGTCARAGVGYPAPVASPSQAQVNADMGSQCAAILAYVSANGDTGAVSMMNGASTVFAAANIWGPQVEKFGINDVHSEGVQAATAIANAVDPSANLTAGD